LRMKRARTMNDWPRTDSHVSRNGRILKIPWSE
jgi:hypothetical protein